ncbi:hypothetical protein ACTXJT_13845 [Corynebacterium casei]|uniref:hypothetical protein n=1 Tax=Corynebacterium casei TaxID=160386 RepID=UPI003FD46A28
MQTIDAVPTNHLHNDVEKAFHSAGAESTSEIWLELDMASLFLGVSKLHIRVLARNGEIATRVNREGKHEYSGSDVIAMSKASQNTKVGFAEAVAKNDDIRRQARIRYA